MDEIKVFKTQDNSLETPPISKEILENESKIEKNERKILSLFTCLGFFVSIIIGLSVYFRLNASIQKQNTTNNLDVLGKETKKEELNLQSDPINKIGYIKNNSVWIYDFLSSQNTQIFQDGGRNLEYQNLAWKNKNELTIVKSQNNLTIFENYNLLDQTSLKLLEIPESKVVYTRWSHQGNMFAFLVDNKNSLSLNIFNLNTNQNIASIPYLSRALDINDSLYIRFSPDDKKVMVVNTLVNESESSITIFDLEGNIIIKLNKEKNIVPTFGFFMNDNLIYYKKDDYLYLRLLDTDKDTKVTDRIVGAFNFQPSPDKSKLTYSTYDWNSGISTIWVYEIGVNEIKRLKDQSNYPIWIDNNNLISLKQPDCIRCPANKFTFEDFVKSDLLNKTDTDLIIDIKNIEQVVYSVENS